MDTLKNVKFDEKGLVPAIAQDAQTGEILIMAWMNEESLRMTIERQIACYYSRSRKKLWIKGESSGNVQKIHDIRLDCDGDVILLKISQTGGACHEGYYSCFFRLLKDGKWVVDGKKMFDPDKVYSHKK